ncbi:hypothetical protein T09_2966 [Trichinella sp. T9]|nr:hypothetical protein T09_2966 [Trichinella sp. T9]
MNMTGCKKARTSLKQLNSQLRFFPYLYNYPNLFSTEQYLKYRRNRNVALVRTATNPTINNETMRNDTVSFCVGALMTVTFSTSRIRIFCLRKDHLAVLVNSSASDVDP